MEKIDILQETPIYNGSLAIWEVKDTNPDPNFALFLKLGNDEMLIIKWDLHDLIWKPNLNLPEGFYERFTESDKKEIINFIKILEGRVATERGIENMKIISTKIKSLDWCELEALCNGI
ncbi:hypothetical protein [Solitalea koreensis]|uniref:Uncharacterized protein n=1 Tax=Solitalea koreensis TaxID=543615 RepID=A0A521DMV5_9SPHI|nr:hypothetical protein [Solitalea koreensis]SMO72260.1 hypothetical protein SAMN06265350_10790 [Solitalea koreensis]